MDFKKSNLILENIFSIYSLSLRHYLKALDSLLFRSLVLQFYPPMNSVCTHRFNGEGNKMVKICLGYFF